VTTIIASLVCAAEFALGRNDKLAADFLLDGGLAFDEPGGMDSHQSRRIGEEQTATLRSHHPRRSEISRGFA
jgi:hypothetical protein